MASEYGSVWAIDIGNNSLKALRLRYAGNVVEVIGFDNIQHSKVLSGSGVKAEERDELIALSLRQFVKQNDLGKDDIIVSVPSQNSFARFVKLPPVEQKRIPEIVKFEAAQQIPFDIDDVQWDWQLMTEAGGPETKVGIFAVKNDVVHSVLEHFARENVTVSFVQMAPMALYNYVLYDNSDLDRSDSQATVILDIGAENSDLVVCTQSTVWQRSVPMGGNAFTRAVADTFKLNFEKAEKLKRTAAVSKYARQVFQAMKPVFTDLVSEIQRSLGFYTTSNPNIKLSRVIALGGGARMRGLIQYLRQTLQIPVEMPDSFKKLTISSSVSAAKFHESVGDFGVVYGLALQGLGLARIECNLLPRSIARSMAWASKTRYFTAAAAALLLVSVMCFARVVLDGVNYANNDRVRQKISSIISDAEQAADKLKAEESKGLQSEAIIQKELKLFDYRDVIPLLHQTIISVLPNEKNNPEQKELYQAFAVGDVKGVKKFKRKQRKQIFITGMSVHFTKDVASAEFGTADFTQGLGQRKSRATALPSDGLTPLTDRPRMPTYAPKAYLETSTEGTGEEESGPGFVVVITGYSPYKDIYALIDPVGVEGEPNKWGFVTRLLRLDDIVDWKNPFVLYKKTDIKHYKLETGEVAVEAAMPPGIGIEDTGSEKAKRVETPTSPRGSVEWILIDPMTKEIISRVPDIDEQGRRKVDRSGKVVYKANDRWFRLYIKFLWKDMAKESSGTEAVQVEQASSEQSAPPQLDRKVEEPMDTGRRRSIEADLME